MNDYKTAREEIARLINVDLKEITYVLYKTKVENSYISFEIPKKNGKNRVIYTPNDKLKWIQRNLSEKLYEIHTKYITEKGIKTNVSHGFEKDKSIITNAYRHKNKKYLLNIDISDFFSSFNFGRVQGYFYKSREFMFSKEVATIIAQLACYKRKLPQGAPTSPIISNLIFNIVDLQILALAKKYKLKDLCNDGNPEKEYSKTIEGFKKAIVKNYRSKAVYDASVAGNLFTVDSNKISELRKALENQLNALTVLKGGKLFPKSSDAKPLPGVSVHKDAISHPIKNKTITYFEKKGKIQNGINIVKENGNYVAK